MTGYHLAQVNIARLLTPFDPSVLGDLVAGLAPVDALGEGQPGFVWRQRPDNGAAVRTFQWAGDATDADHAAIVNLTVWESVDALADFVFGSDHGAFLRQRREWFQPARRATNALWWIPVGHEPGPEEAEDRVRHLRTHGPTATAFTFRLTFPPPDRRISLVPTAGPGPDADQQASPRPADVAARG